MAADPIPQIQPDHDVLIHLVDGTHAVPDIPKDLRVWQTVRYSSPDGKVEITFDTNGSPFRDASGKAITLVQDKEIIKLKVEGVFRCKCFITLPDGRKVGWRPDENPQSGGDHDVGH